MKGHFGTTRLKETLRLFLGKVMYNGILVLPMPNEVKIIVFADDLTVIAVAKNADMDYQRHKNVTADGPV